VRMTSVSLKLLSREWNEALNHYEHPIVGEDKPLFRRIEDASERLV